MRVLSLLLQSKWDHSEGCEVKIVLQPRHTWVNMIRFLSALYSSEWSGMRERTSEGIRFMGANEFFTDRAKLSTSNAPRSKMSA